MATTAKPAAGPAGRRPVTPRGWRRWLSLLTSFVLASLAGGGASALLDPGWAGLVGSVVAFVLVFALCSIALDLLLAPRRRG